MRIAFDSIKHIIVHGVYSCATTTANWFTHEPFAAVKPVSHPTRTRQTIRGTKTFLQNLWSICTAFSVVPTSVRRTYLTARSAMLHHRIPANVTAHRCGRTQTVLYCSARWLFVSFFGRHHQFLKNTFRSLERLGGQDTFLTKPDTVAIELNTKNKMYSRHLPHSNYCLFPIRDKKSAVGDSSNFFLSPSFQACVCTNNIINI